MSNVLKNTYTILFYVDATRCNYNGDPAEDNRPRQDYSTGQGILTDVAVKRRIRDLMYEMYHTEGVDDGYDILMKPEAYINREIKRYAVQMEAANPNFYITDSDDNAGDGDSDNGDKPAKKKGGKKSGKKSIADQFAATDWFCKKFADVRTFGAVLSTGLNAGQVTGACQVGISASVDAVEPIDMQMSRMCVTNLKNEKNENPLSAFDDEYNNTPHDKRRTFGWKWYVPYALFPVHMTISAADAARVGFTEDDFNHLLEVITMLYSTQRTSSKEMCVPAPVIVFKHVGTQHENNAEQNRAEACLGCASAGRLYSLITTKKRPDVVRADKFTDYQITIKASRVPRGVQLGFKDIGQDIHWYSAENKNQFADYEEEYNYIIK